MDAGKLLANFDLVIAAPGGVARVREMILQLAVRGLLVPQDPADGTASEILNMDRYQKNNASDMPSLQNNLPILPSEWCWVRLADLAELSIGRTPDTKNHSYWGSAGFEWVSIADMAHGGILYETKRKVSALAKTDVFRKAPESAGTLLMSYKLTIGKISILGVPAYHNEAIAAIKPDIQEVQNYLLKVLPVFALSGEVNNAIKGRTLNKKTLSALPVAVPPLAEQKRIVAKIDELMSLCDELNEKKQRRDNTHKTLQSSTFNTLATANTPAATTKAWTRIRDHWPTLLSTPESISTLRQTILQLAIRGQLVPQDPNDESAIKRVVQSGEAIIEFMKASKSRKLKYLNSDMIRSPDQVLPAGWAWSALGHLGVVNPRNAATDDMDAGLVRMLHIFPGFMDGVRYENKKWKQIKSGYTHIADGDVVLAKITPCYENGKSAVIKGLPNSLGAGTTELHVFRDVARIFDARFLLAVLKSPEFISAGITRMTGTAGQKRLPAEYFALSPIPVPPLAEQKRIVAKIDQLMSLCDALEARMGDQSSTSRDLARALSVPP